jgi:hypothetical protein
MEKTLSEVLAAASFTVSVAVSAADSAAALTSSVFDVSVVVVSAGFVVSSGALVVGSGLVSVTSDILMVWLLISASFNKLESAGEEKGARKYLEMIFVKERAL